MNHPLVRNIKKTKDFDVYIGRRHFGMHYGNPFTHLDLASTKAQVQVDTVEEAVRVYGLWLNEGFYSYIEPARREWILNHIPKLKGKTLGCYCAGLHACHGDILAALANP